MTRGGGYCRSLRTLRQLGEEPSDEELTPLLPDRWVKEYTVTLLPVSK
jgi:hypothetical protein